MSGDTPSWLGKHVVVTGAASGIGHEIGSLFAGLGATVTGVDLPDARAAVPGNFQHWIPKDLSGADVAAAVETAWKVAPIDVLVNAAGIYPAVPVREVSEAVWDHIMNVNVRAPMMAIVALARLAESAGERPSVVNISSGAAHRSRPGGAVYAVSKAALNMVTKSTALEFGRIGIRVNAVSPGFVSVDSFANPVTAEYKAVMSDNPVGRAGRPADVARAVLWLADPESEWVTGTILTVDGGSSTGMMHVPLNWSGLSPTQTPPVVNTKAEGQDR